MAAYMVVNARIDDMDQFGKYVEAVQPVIAAHGGKLVGRGVPPVVLEGDWPYHTVGILEFASVEAAQAFWDSPEYRAVKLLRDGAADFQVVVAEATSVVV